MSCKSCSGFSSSFLFAVLKAFTQVHALRFISISFRFCSARSAMRLVSALLYNYVERISVHQIVSSVVSVTILV